MKECSAKQIIEMYERFVIRAGTPELQLCHYRSASPGDISITITVKWKSVIMTKRLQIWMRESNEVEALMHKWLREIVTGNKFYIEVTFP